MKITADKALRRLKEGNQLYRMSWKNTGDVSLEKVRDTAKNGQHPYAVVIACSDSRVTPEHIFNAGIGELFTIRVAGNVIDPHQLGSIEYAVSHLGTPLVVVLGHTHCGAVDAAMCGSFHGYITSITDKIQVAIQGERDAYKASCLNVESTVEEIKKSLSLEAVKGAIYDIKTGEVIWL